MRCAPHHPLTTATLVASAGQLHLAPPEQRQSRVNPCTALGVSYREFSGAAVPSNTGHGLRLPPCCARRDSRGHGSGASSSSVARPTREPQSSRGEALCSFLSDLGVSEFRCYLVVERMETEGALPDIDGQAVPVVEALRQYEVERSTLRKVVSDAPGVLCLGGKAVASKLQFLKSMGVGESALSDTLAKCPQLLHASIYEVGCVANFLSSELGVNWRVMPFILERFPSIFLHPPAHNLEPLVHWLEGGMLHLGREETCAMIGLWPQILTYSKTEVQAKCSALEGCGLKKETLRNMITLSPDILSLDLELDVLPTMQFLKECGMSEEQIASLLVAEPRILSLKFSYSTEERKLFFLRKVMGRDVPDLLECPAYALMRLGKVAPRAAFLKQQGRNLHEVPLRDFVHNSDRDWAREIAQVPVNQFNQFRDEFMYTEGAEGSLPFGALDYFFKSSMP